MSGQVRPGRLLIAFVIAGGLALASGCARTEPEAGNRPSVSTAAASVRPASTSPASQPVTATATATQTATLTPTAPATSTAPVRCAAPAGRFITTAPGKGKTVALTFDDGPGPADAQIVAILDRFGIHATFFETGKHAAADPDMVRLLASHGNLIADHSWDHYYPSQVKGGWTVGYLTDQLTRTDTELSGLSGAPVCYFRPPGGFRANVLTTAGKLGLSVALWSVDSQDWRQPATTTSAATARIVHNATAVDGSPHPIVLMHSSKASHEPESQVSSYRGNTVAALPTVIAWYRSHGYRFVLLDGRS